MSAVMHIFVHALPFPSQRAAHVIRRSKTLNFEEGVRRQFYKHGNINWITYTNAGNMGRRRLGMPAGPLVQFNRRECRFLKDSVDS